MRRGKTDVKGGFSAMKKKAGKMMPKGQGGRPKNKAPQRPGTAQKPSFRFKVPVFLQTVIAVLICCGVLAAAGAALFTVEQKEIISLKSDIKAYVDDGVVPAGSMNDIIALSMEAIGGRITTMQTMVENAGDKKLSNEELQWLGTELDAVKTESAKLNDLLNTIEADKNVFTAYKETVQDPLLVVTSAYDGMTVKDADVVDTAVDDGASTNDGTFKSGTNTTASLIYIIVAVVIVLVLGALTFLFRHRLAGLFGGGHGQGKKKKAKAFSGERGAASGVSDRSKGSPSGSHGKKKASAPPSGEMKKHSREVVSDLTAEADREAKSSPVEQAAVDDTQGVKVKESASSDFDFEAEILSSVEPAETRDEDDPLLRLAAMRKKTGGVTKPFAPEEAAPGEQDDKIDTLSTDLGVSEDKLMVFDAEVQSQKAIEEDEDPFFKKE